MNFFTLCFFILVSLISFPTMASSIETEYPPILDYYPNCHYEVIKNYSVRNKTDDSLKQREITNDLLLKLRRKAHNLGADAVILTKKTSKQTVNAFRVAILTIRFEAELIKQCTQDNYLTKNSTAYNHLGEPSNNMRSIKINNSKTFKITFSNNSSVKRPKISNKNVSLTNGVYGIKLGESYQQVIDILGTPNTSLVVFTDEQVIGYGRRHWLHFQFDKLVKIQTTPPLLSQYMINEIPFLDFFDDFQWKINNEIAYKSLFSNIKPLQNSDNKLNKRFELISQNDTAKLTLNFNKYHNDKPNETTYFLNGFTLQNNNYKAPEKKSIINRDKHFSVLTSVISALNKNQAVNSVKTATQLGEPLASIQLSSQKKLLIFNNNLFLEVKENTIRSINLIENIFLADILEKSLPHQWHLGNFKQGKSINDLKPYFPIDSFELDNKVEIDSNELFTLSLLFDDINDKTALYEAKMTLY